MSRFISSLGRGTRRDESHERNMEEGEARTSTPLRSELLKVESASGGGGNFNTCRTLLEGGDDETRSRVRIRNRNWRGIIHSCAAALIFFSRSSLRIRDLNCKTMDDRDHKVRRETCYENNTHVNQFISRPVD